MKRPLMSPCVAAANRTACRWAGRFRALLMLLALALTSVGSAHGGAVWWHGNAAVTRFDPASGQLRTVTLPAPVRALASTPDEGAWVAYGEVLVHLGTDLVPRVSVAIPPAEPATPMLAVADDQGGIWIAHGDAVQHYDSVGERMSAWQHGAPILALAAGGRNAIFLGDQQAIHHYNEQGDVIRVHRLLESDVPSGMLLDRRGGYLWWLGRDAAVQLDVLTGLTERMRITLPAGARAVALDAASGSLWLLGPAHFVALDRDGTEVESSPVPRNATDMPLALAVERAADRLWIGDQRGTTAFNRQSLQWIRLTDGEATVAIAGNFAALAPRLEFSGAGEGTPPTLRFALGAACDPVPCAVIARYLQTLRPNFELDGRVVTDNAVIDAAAGTVEVHDVQPLPGGAGTLRAEVVDAYGNRSPPLVIDVRTRLASRADAERASNTTALKALPTVGITAPLNNAKFVAPATVAIAASAAASGATLTKVEFYRDAVLLGTDSSAPYTYNWTNVAVGTYKLTAKAYDSAGGITTSAIVNIQVNANVAPTVKLTTPANNSAYTAPATINLAATATDTDGTITKVEFFRDTTKLYTATVAPYTYAWSNVAGGTYSLTAKATDDKGALTTSTAVAVKVNKPPTVALTAPANNVVLVSPTNVTISASASDADGTVSKVQFFRDGVLLGTDTTSPYSYAWSNVPPGTYTLKARAMDNLGATTDSAPRTLTVGANQAPMVALTAPANGTSVVAGKPVTLTATASDPDGTISNVKFYAQAPTFGSVLLGTDTTNPYGITVPLYAGDNVLTAVATDNKGASTTSAPVTVTVRSNQDPSITLVSPADGQMFPSLSPPDIALAATASDADGSIVRVRFYYMPWPTEDNPDPARVTIATVTSPPFQAVWPAVPHTGTGFCDENGCAPDGYEVIAEATDDAGGVAQASASITVPAFSSSSIRLTAPREIQPLVYTAPATLVLTAAATVDASVPVVKVQFLADGNVIGTVNGAGNGANGEYVHVWRNIGAGVRSLQARLYDNAGFVVDSTALTVTVRDVTSPPIVTVSMPTNEQTFMTGYQGYPNIPATVVATDADGSLAQVGILFDDALASSSSTSPHSATLNQVRPGLHVIAGNATDNGSAKSLARPVYVRVLENPRLQAVVLTAPAPGSMTNPVVLEAQVGAPDGGVDKVQFYDGATLIGSVTAPPYRLTANLANGAHALKAVTYLYSNVNLASTPVNVTVSGSNLPPNVTLTAPAAGQSFPVGAVVPLAATATDSDGTVAKVEFFVGTTLVATVAVSPYAATWTPAAPGTYAITAKATDNQGATRTTSPVNVTVIANKSPQVALTAPGSGQSFAAGVPFAISANATDADGSITKVDFYAGATLIGTATSPPYALSWAASAAGSYVLTARATDNANAMTASAGVTISVSANALPSVALLLPRDGQRFAAGGTVDLIASASDTDGTVARVEFYSGTTLLGAVSSAPYTYTWTNVASGNYSLSVRVVDNRGAVTSSVAVAVVVAPLALVVTSPTPNVSVAADFVLVTGTYSAPANSGVTVNGVVATVDDVGAFAVSSLPLDPGANTIEVTLTTPTGQSLTRSITLTSTANAPFYVVADPEQGFAPLRVEIRYSSRLHDVSSFQIADLSGGVLDTSQAKNGTLGFVTFAKPGLYRPRVILNHGSGLIYEQAIAVNVRDQTTIDRGFLGMIKDFTTALANGKKGVAMQYLSSPMQVRFGPVFDALSGSMAQIMGSIKGYGAVSINEDIASYAVKKVRNGTTKIFLLDILRDHDGVWRIDSM